MQDELAANSTYRSRIADKKELAGCADLPHIAEFPERAGNAHAVSAHEEADFFMGQGEGNRPASGCAGAHFLRDVNQDLVESSLQARLGKRAHLPGKVFDSKGKVSDHRQPDRRIIQDQVLETLSINAASKRGLQARGANRVLALLQQDAFAQEISGLYQG